MLGKPEGIVGEEHGQRRADHQGCRTDSVVGLEFIGARSEIGLQVRTQYEQAADGLENGVDEGAQSENGVK